MTDLQNLFPEEQIQDASVLLLMDDYAHADGQQLLFRFEKSGITMPEQLDHTCRMQIEACSRESEKRTLLRRTVSRAAKIAAVLVLVCSLSVNLILSVEAIRIPCLNFCIRVTDYFTEIRFTDKQAKQEPQALPFHPPEGYTQTIQNHNYDDFCKIRQDSMLFVGFKSEDGRVFTIDSTPSEGSISIDTENSESISFYLNGMKAIHILKSDGSQTILWIDESRERIYHVFSSHMDQDEFMTYVMVLSLDLMNEEFYDY